MRRTNMQNVRQIAPEVYWVGGNDQRLARFENMFPLPNGVSYNSYLIIDEKITLLDTVDASISRLFLENVESVLEGRKIDYLVINHMEPDHCALIEELARRNPGMKIKGNKLTFQMICQFYDYDMEDHFEEVKDGETLSIGKHTLQFHFTPMVHWPEVMMTYEQSEKILFSADAFGTFGVLPGDIFADESNFEKVYLEEARRYYANIVGKFGVSVQAALKKVSSDPIKMIAPLHGPIWRKNLEYIFEKYQHWSTYAPEEQSVVIIYGSMYGNTANAAEVLASALSEKGVSGIRLYDVSETDPSFLISEIFRCSNIVFAAPTYNLGLYYGMDNLMHEMERLLVQNRKVSLIGNGTWAPTSLKNMQENLSKMKNMEILGKPIQIMSSLKENQMAEINQLAEEIKNSL